MILVLFAVFGVAFLLTLGLVPLARAWARRTGLIDEPGGRKAHAVATPLGGGLAVAAAVTITLGGGILCAWGIHARLLPFPIPESIRIYLPGAVDQAPRLLLILGGGIAIAAIGLVDDRHDLAPRWKLLGQLVVALLLALLGDIRLSLFTEEIGGLGRVVSIAATLLWVAAVTNAFNLLDHLDGVCAGVAAVCGTVFLAVALQTGQLFIAALLAVTVAACAAFLVYNFHPATVFLGDAGSQFIGYLLAVTTILFTFYRPPYPLFSYTVPLLVLAVPFYDMARVVSIRLSEGRNPFQGDRNHLSHRLLRLGFSTRQSAGLVYLLTAATGLSATLLYRVEATASAIVLAQVVLILILVACLDSKGGGEGRRDGLSDAPPGPSSS